MSDIFVQLRLKFQFIEFLRKLKILVDAVLNILMMLSFQYLISKCRLKRLYKLYRDA